MMQQFPEVTQVSKEISLLYVEDEKDTRETMYSLLTRFFDDIKVCENGAIGLSEYKRNVYDLVITDIQMPKMNGLEMIAEIKKLTPDVVVGITTAFNDEQFFVESIDLGVNKYILKPVRTRKMIDAIYYLCTIITNRQKAKKYEQQQIQEKINRAGQDIAAQITKSSPNPTLISLDEQIVYLNDAFCKYFNTRKMYQNLDDIQKLFLPIDNCIQKLDAYKTSDDHENKIAIQYGHFTKYFQLFISYFVMNKQTYQILTFNDITKQEYINVKLENYNSIFRYYIFHYTKNSKKTSCPQTDNEQSGPKPVQKPSFDESLDFDERSILRKSHAYKTSAAEYLEELDEDTLQQIQELEELNKELAELIIEMQREEISMEEGLNEFAARVTMFVRTISILFEFNDLIQALNELVSRIQSLAQDEDDAAKRNAVLFLDAIAGDLKAWVDSIFINQDSLDIHYLDSSLFSSCLQLEMMLKEDENDAESEDIDFF